MDDKEERMKRKSGKSCKQQAQTTSLRVEKERRRRGNGLQFLNFNLEIG
jgi:hypothetical protein